MHLTLRAHAHSQTRVRHILYFSIRTYTETHTHTQAQTQTYTLAKQNTDASKAAARLLASQVVSQSEPAVSEEAAREVENGEG